MPAPPLTPIKLSEASKARFDEAKKMIEFMAEQLRKAKAAGMDVDDKRAELTKMEKLIVGIKREFG